MVESYTPGLARVVCAEFINERYRENHNRGYEFQIEDSYSGEKFKGKEELIKSGTKFIVK